MTYLGDDRVLLFGGHDNTNKLNDTYVYDLSANSWTQITPSVIPTGRYEHKMAYIGTNRVLLRGGDTDGIDNDTYIYDFATSDWTNMNPIASPPGLYYNDCAYLGDDKVLLWGGGGGWPPSNRDAWVYDYSDNTWLLDPNTTTPTAVNQCGLAETSMDAWSEIVMFGGTNPQGYPEDTWLYGGGDYIYSTVGGKLIEDLNNSGSEDAGEPGLQNIDIIITNRHGISQTIETDANGNFTAHIPWGDGIIDVDETDPDFSPSFIKTFGGSDPEVFTLDVGGSYFTNRGYFISSVAISGYVKDAYDNGIEGVAVEFSNGGAIVYTDLNGRYITSVSSGWNGTSTATKDWWSFTPASLSYPNHVTTHLTNQNYVGTAIAISYFISGHIRDINNNGIEGVSVEFSNGGATVFTNATGHYSTSVAFGWNGYSIATKNGWTFTPNMFEYPAHVEEDFFGQDITGQDFVGRVALSINDITNSMPIVFTVLPAYPNPFNPSTTIRYGLESDSYVTLEIYDISGKLITTLQNENQIQGWHSVIWNGINQYGEQAPAGLYFSKITSGNEVETTKLMLLK